MEMSSELEVEFRVILDCFSGADGGVAFMRLRALVEDLEKQSIKGDLAAKRLITLIYQFSKLIRVANGELARRTPDK